MAGAAAAMYVELLHDALAGDGVHAVHTIVVGAIGPDGHDPDDVAERMWREHLARDAARIVIE